jgi:hypothetical protein
MEREVQLDLRLVRIQTAATAERPDLAAGCSSCCTMVRAPQAPEKP